MHARDYAHVNVPLKTNSLHAHFRLCSRSRTPQNQFTLCTLSTMLTLTYQSKPIHFLHTFDYVHVNIPIKTNLLLPHFRLCSRQHINQNQSTSCTLSNLFTLTYQPKPIHFMHAFDSVHVNVLIKTSRNSPCRLWQSVSLFPQVKYYKCVPTEYL